MSDDPILMTVSNASIALAGSRRGSSRVKGSRSSQDSCTWTLADASSHSSWLDESSQHTVITEIPQLPRGNTRGGILSA